jgi:hypothetical protein
MICSEVALLLPEVFSAMMGLMLCNYSSNCNNNDNNNDDDDDDDDDDEDKARPLSSASFIFS